MFHILKFVHIKILKKNILVKFGISPCKIEKSI